MRLRVVDDFPPRDAVVGEFHGEGVVAFLHGDDGDLSERQFRAEIKIDDGRPCVGGPAFAVGFRPLAVAELVRRIAWLERIWRRDGDFLPVETAFRAHEGRHLRLEIQWNGQERRLVVVAHPHEGGGGEQEEAVSEAVGTHFREGFVAVVVGRIGADLHVADAARSELADGREGVVGLQGDGQVFRFVQIAVLDADGEAVEEAASACGFHTSRMLRIVEIGIPRAVLPLA